MSDQLARLAAAYAALQAVDRAQRQWLACVVEIYYIRDYGSRGALTYRGAKIIAAEAWAQLQIAQAAATAALAAAGVALEASPPPAGDLAHLIAQEHETARALGCRHPDNEGE